MTALIRTVMKVLIARILASPIGPWASDALDLTGISEERLADFATIIVLGIGVAAAKALKAHPIGASVLEWINLILSWGRSKAGPEYQPKHLAS